MTFPAPAPTTGPTPNAMPGAAAAAAAQAVPPAAPPAAAPAPAVVDPAAPPAAAAPADPAAPPWGADENFDPAKAWSLIQNLRLDNTETKAKLAAAQPILDAADQQRRDEQGALATANEDITAARAEAAKWRNQVVQSAAKTLASDKGFSVPDAALAMVGDLTDYTGADGLDTDKFTARLEELATEYPGLLVLAPESNQPPQRPFGMQPDRGQGQAGTAPNNIDEQIKAAQARGDFTTVIALRQQKAYASAK